MSYIHSRWISTLWATVSGPVTAWEKQECGKDGLCLKASPCSLYCSYTPIGNTLHTWILLSSFPLEPNYSERTTDKQAPMSLSWSPTMPESTSLPVFSLTSYFVKWPSLWVSSFQFSFYILPILTIATPFWHIVQTPKFNLFDPVRILKLNLHHN